jgi:hypothetical protein
MPTPSGSLLKTVIFIITKADEKKEDKSQKDKAEAKKLKALQKIPKKT